MLSKIIKFFLTQKLVTVMLLVLLTLWGIVVAPFGWQVPFLPSDPVPVDAIPDIGENQQIVYTEWMGRSPQDVEDQITYPLTSVLLGVPGVKVTRSTSMFGFSSIYIIFEDDVDFYWSRSRILEKLNALPANLLPEGVTPQLGPDATGLGQVFFYTLEGQDASGKPTGGWELHELRSIQDYFVRYALAGTPGVAEVASIGGHVREYQVELDPVAMREHGVSLMQVMEAVRGSNLDVGANTMEVNQVEYIIRGLGYVKRLEDIEEAVLRVVEGVPLRVQDVARVQLGPSSRAERAILDKGGAETVGGVVVARYGDNPLKVIEAVKEKIAEISPGLPSKQLADGTISKVQLVPFYDRSGLIKETLYTLNEAISLQMLLTIIVIMVMVGHLRASLLIAALLPLAVLMCFILMKYVQVDANIVALSGIAIAIGTMVDLGIILNENILRHLEEAKDRVEDRLQLVLRATTEVSGAILTAVMTTIISFLPVFTLQAAEGKLFGPLAYTKTFALIAALFFTLLIMPALAHWVLGSRLRSPKWRWMGPAVLLLLGVAGLFISFWVGVILLLLGVNQLLPLLSPRLEAYRAYQNPVALGIGLLTVSTLLAEAWRPLGPENSLLASFFFIVLILGLVLGGFALFLRVYERLLRLFLRHALLFMLLPLSIMGLALLMWLGFPRLWQSTGAEPSDASWYKKTAKRFPGMGNEFMPALDEGAFLLMPSAMPHSGVEANREILRQLDLLVQAIPEVEMVVGKAGRAESPLDPAPLSMYENIINYKSEYLQDVEGRKLRFQVDEDGFFPLRYGGKAYWHDRVSGLIWDEHVRYVDQELRREILADLPRYLIADPEKGRFYRQWRDHIRSPDDIWYEIQHATSDIPGVTAAPRLQPIETRLVMLQTGMRAPMGMKVYGPDLETIEAFSLELESALREVPGVKAEAVFADRSLGKPYIEVAPDRREIARFGLSMTEIQEFIELAIGGMAVSTTVEGRERYAIRLRYAREYRDDPDRLRDLLVPTPSGAHVPLGQLAEIRFRPGR
ncbi:acriflavin resistance protein [Nitritalea halalkaliphila LW7]|uniref:Acriflavin resistance protein n=1 Tax=Nitritalea halalkaliphila LW7 TaxID=1189621 RepID=I5C9L8_9BACT|nr:acriflavin resistance protein [Nitritalea halalkaliphila LW7]